MLWRVVGGRCRLGIVFGSVAVVSILGSTEAQAQARHHRKAGEIYKTLAACVVRQEHDSMNWFAKVLVLNSTIDSYLSSAIPSIPGSIGLNEAHDMQRLSVELLQELREMSAFVEFYKIGEVAVPAELKTELHTSSRERKLSDAGKRWMRDKRFNLALWFQATKTMNGAQEFHVEIRDFRYDRCNRTVLVTEEISRDWGLPPVPRGRPNSADQVP